MNNPLSGTDPTGYTCEGDTETCADTDPGEESGRSNDRLGSAGKCSNGHACGGGVSNGSGGTAGVTDVQGVIDQIGAQDQNSPNENAPTAKNQMDGVQESPEGINNGDPRRNFRQRGERGFGQDDRFPPDTITLAVDNDNPDFVIRLIPSQNLIVWEDRDGNIAAADTNDLAQKFLVNGVVSAALSGLGGVFSVGRSGASGLGVSTRSIVGRKGQNLGGLNPKKPTNVAAQIDGKQFSGHALDRMQSQGITPSAVFNAIRNGQLVKGKVQGTNAHHDRVNNLTVITDAPSGRIITVDRGIIKQ